MTGSSIHTVFRQKSEIENVSSDLWQFWIPLTILSILSMNTILKSFASGRGNYPLGNILDGSKYKLEFVL